MDPFDMLLGLDIEDEEKTRLLADSLRGRQRAADFFSGVQTPHVGGLAALEQERVPMEAERVGALRRALAERQQRQKLQDERHAEARLAATLSHQRQMARDKELERMGRETSDLAAARDQGYGTADTLLANNLKEPGEYINPKTKKTFRAKPGADGRMYIEGTEIPLPPNFIKYDDYYSGEGKATTAGGVGGRLYNRRRFEDMDGNIHEVGSTADGTLVEETPGGVQLIDPEAFETWGPALTESQRANYMGKLGNETQQLTRVMMAMEHIDDLMEPYAREGADPDSIPGLGFFEKMPFVGPPTRMVQDVAFNFGDSPMESAPHGTMNSALSTLHGYLIREQAGLAQTKIELERVMQNFGKDWASETDTLIQGLDRLKDGLERDMLHIKDTTHPAVFRSFQRQLEQMSDDARMRDPFAHRFRRFDWYGENGGGVTTPPSQGWGEATQE